MNIQEKSANTQSSQFNRKRNASFQNMHVKAYRHKSPRSGFLFCDGHKAILLQAAKESAYDRRKTKTQNANATYGKSKERRRSVNAPSLL